MNNKQNELKQINKAKNADLSVLSLLIFAFLVVSLGVILFTSSTAPWKKVNLGGFIVKPPIISEKDGAIKKFKDYGELKDFLSKGVNDISNLYGMGLSGMDGFALTDGIARKEITTSESWGAENKPSGVPMELGIGNDDYSTTNIQVAGVDEGDIIKTDGECIYAVSGNEVSIAKAYPAEDAKIVSTIKFDSAPNGIYISGNKLAVYGQNYNVEYSVEEYENILPRRNSSYTYLKIFDVSDKSNPKEEKTLDFEGNFVNSRMIKDYVYLVTQANPYYYAFDKEIPVPLIIEDEKVITVDPNSPTDKFCVRCVSPDVYYFDIPYHSYNLTSVNAINIADSGKKVNSEVYVLDGNQNSMFVSRDNIYITFAKYVSEEELTIGVVMEMIKEKIYPRLSAKDREMVSEIEKTENYILSPQEKFAKIAMILQKYESVFANDSDNFEKELEERVKQKYEDISKELEKTMIHKIAINGKSLKYESFGEVPGVVLNQFSMDEDGGYFRIATTKNRTWSNFVDTEERESYNNLYVLDDNMKVVGEVEGLAKGERIYSVRFMQNRAYMVTFRQTDPLFVIDLSSPANPKVLGKLKVPGFSSYLHPYDETTLIGLGKETDDSGRITGGVKLSLFDVADVENPKELDKYVLGDTSSSSIAIDDHKAFLFSKDKNLLVIPVNMRDKTWGISFKEDEKLNIMPTPLNKKYFNGAAVFSIDKYRFNLRGKIDHSDTDDNSNWYDYNKAVKRSLYIKDALYTFSDKYIKANSLADLKEINTLKLNASENDYLYPTPGPIPIPMPRPMNLPE